MAVMEVTMVTGFTPDLGHLEELLKDPVLELKKYEVHGKNLVLYFNKVINCHLTSILSTTAGRKSSL